MKIEKKKTKRSLSHYFLCFSLSLSLPLLLACYLDLFSVFSFFQIAHMTLLVSLASKAPRASPLEKKHQQQKQKQKQASLSSSSSLSPLTPKALKTLSSPRGRLSAFRPPSASSGSGGGGNYPSPRGDNENKTKREKEEDEAGLLQREYPLLAPPSSPPPPLVPVLSLDTERTVGRTAMLGFACAVAGEVLAGGGGPLSQLRLLSGLVPHFALDALLACACASGLLFALSPVVRGGCSFFSLFSPELEREREREGEREKKKKTHTTSSFFQKLKKNLVLLVEQFGSPRSAALCL